MSTLIVTPTRWSFAKLTLRMITATALATNALLFLSDAVLHGPNDLNLGHAIPTFVIACIVMLRSRWVTGLGALLGALLLVDAAMFLADPLWQPDAPASFVFSAVFFATALVAMVWSSSHHPAVPCTSQPPIHRSTRSALGDSVRVHPCGACAWRELDDDDAVP